MIIETGERAGLHSRARFPMQSVYKLPIAMAVLAQVDAGKLRLDQSIRITRADLLGPGWHSPIRDQHPGGDFDMKLEDLLRAAVQESDGTASDVLLRTGGGPAAIMRFLHELGAHDVTIATSEKEMGRDERVQYRNWATPEGMVGLLQLLEQGRGLSSASRSLLFRWLIDTPTGPHRLKAGLPETVVLAHQTGASGVHDGLCRATNDTGIITLPSGKHVAIAVFLSDSRSSTEIREAAIARAAKTVWEWAAGR